MAQQKKLIGKNKGDETSLFKCIKFVSKLKKMKFVKKSLGQKFSDRSKYYQKNCQS